MVRMLTSGSKKETNVLPHRWKGAGGWGNSTIVPLSRLGRLQDWTKVAGIRKSWDNFFVMYISFSFSFSIILIPPNAFQYSFFYFCPHLCFLMVSSQLSGFEVGMGSFLWDFCETINYIIVLNVVVLPSLAVLWIPLFHTMEYFTPWILVSKSSMRILFNIIDIFLVPCYLIKSVYKLIFFLLLKTLNFTILILNQLGLHLYVIKTLKPNFWH